MPWRRWMAPLHSSFVTLLGERCQHRPLAKTSYTLGGAPQILFGNQAFGESLFEYLKLVQRHEPWNRIRSGCSFGRICFVSCRLGMDNVCSAIAKEALHVTSTPSSRLGGATDSPCPFGCARCGKCTLTTLTCSRCVTGRFAIAHRVGSTRGHGRCAREAQTLPGATFSWQESGASSADKGSKGPNGAQGAIGPPAVFVRELTISRWPLCF